MKTLKNKPRAAGIIIILGMMAGIFSIAPAVDSSNYLTEASANTTQVITSAVFQFLLFLAYLGFAIILFPLLKRYNYTLALGFLSFRMVAGAILIMGTVVLLAILGLSHQYVNNPTPDMMMFQAFGNVLKTTRDYINHVFMVLALGAANLMLYMLFLRARLLPWWLSQWGLWGTLLSMFASFLLLFEVLEVISAEYLVLNLPIALLELVLGFWLIAKGFDKPDGKFVD